MGIDEQTMPVMSGSWIMRLLNRVLLKRLTDVMLGRPKPVHAWRCMYCGEVWTYQELDGSACCPLDGNPVTLERL